MTTLQILIEARKLIEKPENWGGGPRTGDNCIQTAITTAAAARWRVSLEAPALDAISAAIGVEPSKRSAIWNWNDAPERTHAEVIAAFDKAIEAERAKVSDA